MVRFAEGMHISGQEVVEGVLKCFPFVPVRAF